MTLRAGVAVVDITPPVGTPLDGYGGRLDNALGVHDPLHARAIVLDDGSTRVALVVCDLVGVGAHLVASARELIGQRPGIPPENVLIAATHTHAGPAGVRGRGDQPLITMLARTIAGAVLAASLNLQEVNLKYGFTSVDGISQNRRDPAWPIDNRLDVLAFDTPDARNLATLARYSCHPTVMTGDNLLISADYPGAACATIESVVGDGARALYFNGCCANINPSWVRREFDEVHRVGSVLGAHAAGISQLLRPLGGTHAADNIRWSEATPRPVTAGRLAGNAALKTAVRRFAAPYRTGPSDAEMARRIEALRAEHDAASGPAKREIAARLTAASMERISLQRVADRGATREQEVQAVRLGDRLFLLALPGEVFVETQEEIRAAFGGGDIIIVSYANDYPGYFCRAEGYAQGGYEAGVTPFAPGADALLAETALTTLAEVR